MVENNSHDVIVIGAVRLGLPWPPGSVDSGIGSSFSNQTNSRENVAEVREETSVIEAALTGVSDRLAATSLDLAGKKSVHTARLLVDASGREAFIGAKSGWRQPARNWIARLPMQVNGNYESIPTP